MNKNIVIIHYNTPYLTECLVRSINLFVRDAVIYIFDNSDKSPFVAEFDNVRIIDNTKGQIINFDEWLDKYPNRTKSFGRTNGWASAKHCYSVEKCMELIKENFILLDSDVLLKKDISDLYDEESIYIGKVIKQPKFNVDRVLPFICYINTEMCIKNNIHYFDEEHMYGLHKSSECEKYDTGSSFHLNCRKFNHKEVEIDDYIVHYKAGSWVNTARTVHHYKQIDASEWLKKYKKYWSDEKNKKVVYTCITGGYDTLIDPKFVTDGFDYVCFTDNDNMESDIWKIRPLPKETDNLSQVKKQRYVKINAHKVLPEYELSIWVDGNVTVKGDLNEFVDKFIKSDCSIYVPKHPSRDCIYSESNAVISIRKDTKENVMPQIDRYKEEGLPKHYGLLQSNIMLRKHNEEGCIRFMEQWFEELKNGSHRDQLSFNYVAWKNDDIKIFYLDKMIYKSQWFNWVSGHKKGGNKSIKSVTTTHNSELKKRIAANRERFKQLINNRRMTTTNIRIY